MRVEADAMVGQAREFADRVMEILSGYALNLIGAAVIVMIGWIFAGWSRRRLRAAPMIDDTVAPYVANVAYYLILLFTVVAMLSQFGVQTASIIAALGAAGVAIGLAMQGALSNVAAGVLLLVLRPFKVGDYIETAVGAGTVEMIGLFTTTFTTHDGVFVTAPNSGVFGGPVTNYSRNPTRMASIPFGIAYGEDIDKARGVLQRLMDEDERVLTEPASGTMVTALGDSAVEINMRCWVKTADYWTFLFDMRQRAKQEFDAAGVTIPFPQREVRVIETRG